MMKWNTLLIQYCLFFFKDLFIYWKRRVTETVKETRVEIFHLIHSLNGYSQSSGTSFRYPKGMQGLKDFVHLLLLCQAH